MDERVDLDSALLKAKAGDREAFDKVVSRHRDRLQSLIYLRLGNRLRQRVDMEDALQETLLRAYVSLKRFEPREQGSLFGWLGAIAEHVIQDLFRKHLGRQKGGLDLEVSLDGSQGEAAGVEAPGVSPSRALRRYERLERLEKALAKLSPDHREAILLAHVRGLQTGEVARAMGRSRPAAAMLLLRARQALRDVFGSTDSLHLPAREPGGDGALHGRE